MTSLMISAGEASGDLHAANLVKALHNLAPEVAVKGMGSDALRQAGCEILVDCADIAVVGIWEVIKHYSKIKAALKRMEAELTRDPPDLLLLVDYQEFNFRLAAKAKALGIKVLFYISPQVWAWRSHRVYHMGEKIDHMAVLFPFEEKFYRDAGVPCTFVGNPLVDEAKATRSKAESLEQYQLLDDRPVVGIFPGSRKSEVARILPILLKTAEYLQNHRGQQGKPSLQWVLPMASTITQADIDPLLADYPQLQVRVVKDLAYNVMQTCDAIMTASGTATLEIALMGIPSTIVYRIAPLSYFILRRMMTIDTIGLVNIVAEKPVVKEFLQGAAKPEDIAREVERLLEDHDYKNNMIAELNQIRGKLGKEGGSRNIAELALTMIREQ